MSLEFKKPTLLVLLFASILAICFNVNRDYFSLSTIIIVVIFLIFKRKYTDVFIVLILLTLAFSISLISVPPKPNKEIYTIKITQVKSSYYIGEEDGYNFLFYKNNHEVGIGSIVKLYGRAITIKSQTIPLIFNFKQYMHYQKVFYQIDYQELEIILENQPLQEKIKEGILKGIEEPSKTFIRLFIFNEKGDDIGDIYANLSMLSLLHLFTISGYHINLISSLFCYILSKKLNPWQSRIISAILLLPYVWLLYFALSATRALLYLIFKSVNKIFDLQFSNIDILAIIAFIFIVINPLVIFNLSFIYTFILVFAIELSKNLIKSFSNLVKSFIISNIAFYSLLPVTLYINYEINLITPFVSFLITPIVSFIYIFSLITLAVKPLQLILNFAINLFSNFLANLQIFNIILIFGKPSLYFIYTYYIIFLYILILYQKRKFKDLKYCLYLFYLLILYQYLKVYLNPFSSVNFIDVGQGDSTLIVDKFARSVIMIDTGGFHTSDLAQQRLIPYLKALGIKRIDYLIITHSDFDHNGAMESLVNNYKVANVIEENNFSELTTGGLIFKNLNEGANNNNDNDNSIVLYTKISGYNYLFTGDISSKIESQILTNFPDLKVDFLKIAHHGSNTSNSHQFLYQLDVKYAFISCGLNNYYDHPGSKTLETLNALKIIYYRTDYNGLIKIEHIGNKFIIKPTK